MRTATPQLRLVFWETTQACNLACKHCRASAVTWRDPGELSHKEACGLMDDMVALGRPVLVFSGGEPLLRPDIFELMGEARKRGLPFALSTNGTLLDEAMSDRVAMAGPHRVSISLDGHDAASHDGFRRYAGAFDAALLGIRRLRARGVQVQVNTSVTTHNHAALPKIYDLVKREGCIAWHLFMLVPVGCGLEIPQEQRLAAGQYERILRWFAEEQNRTSMEMKATCAPQVVRIARQMFPQGLPAAIRSGDGAHPPAPAGKGCLAGRAVCFVSRFGRVQGCGYLPVTAGHLREENLDEIWNVSPLFSRLREPANLDGKCGACEFKADCMGCRARAFSATGDPFAEEPNCAWQPASLRPSGAPNHG